MTLSHQDGVSAVTVIQGCQDVDVLVPPLDLGGANKDSRDVTETFHVERGLKARSLTPVAISSNRNRERPVTPLIVSTVEHVLAQQNQAGAGAKDRHLIFETSAEFVFQS